MKGTACLLAARDDPFTRTLELELAECFDAVTVTDRAEGIPPCHLLVLDLDLTLLPPSAVAAMAERCLGYTRGALPSLPFPVLSRPFPMEEWRRAVRAEGKETAATYTNGCILLPDGSVISLTEREDALFLLLYEADGSPVAREHLAEAVFPDAAAPEKCLNVYIHYLRKKLERNGKRAILAHRGGGYSLRREALC